MPPVYGPDHDNVDPFDITVRRTAQNPVDGAFDAAYLHPVIRHHGGGELLGTHHMAENLENHRAHPDVHHAPLALRHERPPQPPPGTCSTWPAR
ncbi:hypothetical protein ACWDGI_23405 [Streptomyces sp. NPDC001220]